MPSGSGLSHVLQVLVNLRCAFYCEKRSALLEIVFWRFAYLYVLVLFCHLGQHSVHLYPNEHYQTYHVEPGQKDYTSPELSVKLIIVKDVGNEESHYLVGNEQEDSSRKSSGGDPPERYVGIWRQVVEHIQSQCHGEKGYYPP